ncbi:MAG TPA: Uma2 family endonuclease [Epsilonproteobacteria bacterium]|nr:Uma2 family endonuclease [Campylobacterota bacterium]
MDEAVKLDHYTYDDYLDIDQSTTERIELIDGKIYMMTGASALHQDIVLNLGYLLKNLSKIDQKCFPRIAPFDLKLNNHDHINVVQPDLMLFCRDDIPCAIFEVLSPSTAYKDKTVKKELYEANGIKEYFLVNPEFKIIEKFILKEQKYVYDKAYGAEESVEILCLNQEIEAAEVFESL